MNEQTETTQTAEILVTGRKMSDVCQNCEHTWGKHRGAQPNRCMAADCDCPDFVGAEKPEPEPELYSLSVDGFGSMTVTGTKEFVRRIAKAMEPVLVEHIKAFVDANPEAMTDILAEIHSVDSALQSKTAFNGRYCSFSPSQD